MDIQSFFKVTYGLYIVTSRDGDKLNGHISNTVFQVSADPARFAIATHKDNLTTDYIRKSKYSPFPSCSRIVIWNFWVPGDFSQAGK